VIVLLVLLIQEPVEELPVLTATPMRDEWRSGEDVVVEVCLTNPWPRVVPASAFATCFARAGLVAIPMSRVRLFSTVNS
jgi:hypothetical protein